MYRLRITVDEIRGFCDLPVKEGDYFEVDGGRLIIPPGKYICIWALQAMMPFLTAKQREIAEENDWVPTTSKIMCPDPNGMVIYRVERVGARTQGRQQQENKNNERKQGKEKQDEITGQEVPGNSPEIDTTDGKTPPRMLVQSSWCAGCRRCELACSFEHTGQYWPEASRIKVAKDEHHGEDTPLVCRQCGTARCLEACPVSALSRDPVTRAIILDTEQCIRCFQCQKACPFGAIHKSPEGYPLICDLCGGNPKCVEACPTSAIRFGHAGDPARPPRFQQPGKEKPRRISGIEGAMFRTDSPNNSKDLKQKDDRFFDIDTAQKTKNTERSTKHKTPSSESVQSERCDAR